MRESTNRTSRCSDSRPMHSASEEPKDFLVLRRTGTRCGVFLACQTQWRVAPMGGICGLDYQAVWRVMEWLEIAGSGRRLLRGSRSWSS